MSYVDLVAMVLGNLTRMKLRSALTTTGVMIGTAAIIMMVSIGIGLQTFVTTNIESIISADTIMVFPGEAGSRPGGEPGTTLATSSNKLDEKAIKDIERISGVENVDPQLNLAGARIVFRRAANNVSLISGLTPAGTEKMELSEGRKFKPGEQRSMIIGNRVPDSFTDERSGRAVDHLDMLGRSLTLGLSRTNEEGETETKDVKIKVVGIAEAVNPQEDYNVYLPIKTLENYVEWTVNQGDIIRRKGYDQLLVEAESIDKVESVEKELQEKEYNAFAFKNVVQGLSTVFTVIQAILGGVGGVALIVAAIGIINTMIMSIYERTREIGIMKAIGASNKDVLKIFLLEAGTIGILGGIGGILLSFLGKLLLNFGLGVYLRSLGGEPVNAMIIPFWLILFALAFAFIVGVASGVYPARRAAKLSPLAALRYE